MRSEDLGVIKGAYNMFSQEQSLEMFRKMCDIRYFEENTAEAYRAGLMKMPIYLSIGQESIPAAISTVYKNPSIFAQHRGHGYYLANEGDKRELIDELLNLDSGCAKGMGGSASIHSPKIGMYGHDGLMGSNVPIATGYSFAKNFKKGEKENSLVVFGDSAAEEDYVGSSFGWAKTKRLPILYVCEDNNLSILTEVKVRRNWGMSDLAKGYGLESVDIADDPWTIMYYANKLQKVLPAFINIHTSRDVWHAGANKDDPPTEWPWWRRFDLVKGRLKEEGLEEKINAIEEGSKRRMKSLWLGNQD